MRADNSPYRFVQASCMVIRASATLAHGVMGSGSTTVAPDANQKATPYTLDDPLTAPASRASTLSLLYSEPTSNGSTLPRIDSESGLRKDEYMSIRPAVIGSLLDLEDFFSIPVARAADCRPTMAMLAECAEAVVALSGRDRHAVSPGLVDALTGMITDAWVVGTNAGDPADGGSDEEERQAREEHGQAARRAVRLLRRTMVWDGTMPTDGGHECWVILYRCIVLARHRRSISLVYVSVCESRVRISSRLTRRVQLYGHWCTQHPVDQVVCR